MGTRALLLPQVVTTEVAAESDVYSFKCIERALRARGPAFTYWWLRQGDEGKMPEMPGRAYLYREYPAGFYSQMAMAHLGALYDLFSWQRGVYPVDVVFTSRAAVGAMLQLALAPVTGQPTVPVVLTEPRVYGPGEHGHNSWHPTQLALRAAGYATCFGCYWSKWERDSAIAAAESYCAPAVVDRMRERAFVVDALVDVSGLVKEVTRQATPKRLLFAGRLNSNKKYEEIIQAYGQVLQARPPGSVEVWVHAGTGAFAKLEGADHRWHRTSERLPHAEYWGLLGTAHVGAYMSTDEGANVTTQEMIASGVVLALPRAEWVRKQFDPYEYPFQVSGMAELPAMLDWLLDHYDEAAARLAPIRAFIERARGWEAYRRKFERLMQAVEREPKPEPYRKFRELVSQLFQRGEGAMPFFSALATVPQWQTGAPEYTAIRGAKACYEAVRELDDFASAEPVLQDEAVAYG
jgi:glycosyltransferase involved in cell wall biosynthesis